VELLKLSFAKYPSGQEYLEHKSAEVVLVVEVEVVLVVEVVDVVVVVVVASQHVSLSSMEHSRPLQLRLTASLQWR
jgi:hypothetical protein